MAKKVIIIGNGISGVTAARNIRKMSNYEILIISDESRYFYSRTALMYIYMGHMTFDQTKPYENWFWKKNKIDLVQDRVKNINTENSEVELRNGEKITYDYLILAIGSKPNILDWPGRNLKAVQGLYHLKDLKLMEEYSDTTQHAVIVGGGLIGIEMAEMFLSRNIKVSFLIRENSFWNIVLPEEESAMINRVIQSHHIDLRLNTELNEIIGNEEGRVEAVKINSDEIIDCEFVGITIGVHPNIEFLNNTNIETERGILVDKYLQTNIPNIYAIGDCTQQRAPLENRRPFEQIWYTGRIMGRTVAQTICKEKTAYKPGIWFNSAKFFDLEYQVYGWVYPQPKDNEDSFFWEHQDGLHALRLIYDKNDERILGFNCMGLRFRHKVCDKWIEEKRKIDYVLQNLALANFDPEFYKCNEADIIRKYNTEKNKKIKLKSKRRLLEWFAS